MSNENQVNVEWGTHPRHAEEVADLRSHVIQSAQAMLNFDSIDRLIIEPVLTPEFHEAADIETETPITAGNTNHEIVTWNPPSGIDTTGFANNLSEEDRQRLRANIVTGTMQATGEFRIDESTIIKNTQSLVDTGHSVNRFLAGWLLYFLNQRDQIIHDLMIDKGMIDQDALPPNVLRQEVKQLQESLKEKDKEMLLAMATVESLQEKIAELEESITYLEDLHAGRITNEHP